MIQERETLRHLTRKFLSVSSLTKINSKMVKPQKEEPPYEKKGNGMPMTGMRPMAMETLMAKWKKKMLATQ